MAARIQVLLDYPFTELIRSGWGAGKSASAVQFATFQPERNTGLGIVPAGFKTGGEPEGIWKQAGTNVITLKPILESRGPVKVDDPFYHGFGALSVNVSNDDDGSPGLTYLNGLNGVRRVRKSGASTLVELLIVLAIRAILATWSGSLVLAWQTQDALLANEGWAVYVQPVKTFVDAGVSSLFGYMAFLFGSRYALRIDLHGFAILAENLGTDTSPNWIERKTMDLGGAGLNLRENFRVTIIPLENQAIVFRFANGHSRVFGLRPTSYDQSQEFVYFPDPDSTYYDSALDMNVCVPPGKLGIALQSAGVDYCFIPYKLRYPTDAKTAYLTSESMDDAIPDAAPTLTAYGYASGFTHGGQGSLTLDLVSGESGGAWDPDTDTKPTAKITMSASSNGVWTPSMFYYDARVDPVTQVPPWQPYDASQEWYRIEFRLSSDSKPNTISLKLDDTNRQDSIYRRGGPIRILIDGNPVCDGYLDDRRPTLGLNTTESEYQGSDMWCRLKVPCGRFETLDGKTVADIIRKLLNRAGFTNDQIQIENSELAGRTFEDFQDTKSLKLFTDDATVDDALTDIIQKTSIQGCDAIRIRWVGDRWRVYFAPDLYDDSLEDPGLVFFSDTAAASGISDDDRWSGVDGRRYLRITSKLEPYSIHPDFNVLKATTADKTDDSSSALEIVFKPDQSVTSAADMTATRKQEFEGRLRTQVIGPPQIDARTMGELELQGRFLYDRAQRAGVGMAFQAEWQPGIGTDDVSCVVVGRLPGNPTLYSFGVFRVEEIEVQIDADNVVDMHTGETIRRDYSWSGSYTLHYLRATSAEFPYPMFTDILPPPGR